MGSLAKLVWLRLEGERWGAAGVRYRCTGTRDGHACWLREGHGDLDLTGALRESCNLAFLAWASPTLASAERNDAQRARVEAAFAPFRSRPTPGVLPPLGPDWVGDGPGLQTSPEAFLQWLTAPAQAGLRDQLARLLGQDSGAWLKTGTAPVPGRPGVTAAWVAGWTGTTYGVLRLPEGRGKVEGLARWRALLMERP